MRHEDVPTKCDQQPDGSWNCKACGSDILGAQVVHSIWEHPEMCAGSGSTETEIVPYCPKCETKPAYHGTPITPR